MTRLYAALAFGLLYYLMDKIALPRIQSILHARAELLPIVRWAPFNLTLLVPGTSPYDQHRIPQRVLGMPAALLSQDLIAATAAAGLLLRRLARRRP